MSSAGVMQQWPLVGRDAEIEWALSAVADGGVVLGGGAGVGKSRLARAVVERLRASGRTVAWVAANRAIASIPFGAFAHIVSVDAVQGITRFELLSRLRDAIAALSGEEPVVLGVDDVHSLDEASAALVHHVVTTGVATPVLTVRSHEAVDDTLSTLWTSGLATRFDLQPLGPTDVLELLEAALGGPVDTDTARSLARRSDGNALFLRELVAAGIDSGRLRDVGVWRWRGDFVSTERLVEVVGQRMGALGPEEQAVVEFVALGEPLEATVAESMVASTSVLASLERRGLIVEELSGRRRMLRLGHPLYGDVMRDRTPGAARSGPAATLARGVEATGGRRQDDTLRIATWLLESDDRGHTDLLCDGASRALHRLDFALAQRLARAALEGGPNWNASYTLAAASPSAEELIDLARPLIDSAPSDDDRFEAAMQVSTCLVFLLGRADDAEEAVASAERLTTDPDALQALATLRAEAMLFSARPRDALRIVEGIFAGDHIGHAARMRAGLVGGLALALGGASAAGVDMLERELAWVLDHVGERVHDAGDMIAALAVAFEFDGRLADAEAIATQMYEFGEQHGSVAALGMGTGLLGRSALRRGHIVDATRRLRECVVLAREDDRAGLLPWYLALLAEAEALAGNMSDARRHVAVARTWASTTPRLHDTEVQRAEAWVAAAAGELSRARCLATDAAHAAIDCGLEGLGLLAMHDALRLGAPDAAEEVLQLAPKLQGRWAPAFAAHAEAVRAHDAPRLLDAADGFEQLGCPLLAAECFHEAATEYRRAAVPAGAARAAARASTLMTAIGATSPVVVPAEFEVAALPDREREIVLLVAQGLSNREIAERLVLNVRTVEGHVLRACAKLGVTSRSEVAPLLELGALNPPRS